VRYAFIQKERVNYPVRVLCRVMHVSVSGFYHWRGRPPSARSLEQTRVLTALRVAHARGRGFYGPKKLRDELLDSGLDVGINRIRRLRHKHGIYCLHKKRFRTTTESNHRHPVAPNLLGQCFATTRPAEAWVADITYVDTDEGWLYVAGVKDLFTKELVGWAIDTRLTDRGVQYACGDYQHRLRLYGMQPSMSRKGNCRDNAPMESFFAIFKTELVYQQQFATRDGARAAIFEYIEVFYNRQRRHASIGNLSPAEFERRYHAAQIAT
jgi:putative transposase